MLVDRNYKNPFSTLQFKMPEISQNFRNKMTPLVKTPVNRNPISSSTVNTTPTIGNMQPTDTNIVRPMDTPNIARNNINNDLFKIRLMMALRQRGLI